MEKGEYTHKFHFVGSGGKELLINDIADHVADEDMGFLNARTVFALAGAQQVIDFTDHFPAVSPREPDG